MDAASASQGDCALIIRDRIGIAAKLIVKFPQIIQKSRAERRFKLLAGLQDRDSALERIYRLGVPAFLSKVFRRIYLSILRPGRIGEAESA